MTFDELWRLDLARQRALTNSIDKAEEIELFDDAVSNCSALDPPDDGEVNRFLEWLEQSLLPRKGVVRGSQVSGDSLDAVRYIEEGDLDEAS